MLLRHVAQENVMQSTAFILIMFLTLINIFLAKYD